MTIVGEGCRALSGNAQSQLRQNRTIAYADLVHSEDRDSLLDTCQASLDEYTACSNEYRIITNSGKIRWVWDRGEGVYAADGTLQDIEGFVQDIADAQAGRGGRRHCVPLYTPSVQVGAIDPSSRCRRPSTCSRVMRACRPPCTKTVPNATAGRPSTMSSCTHRRLRLSARLSAPQSNMAAAGAGRASAAPPGTSSVAAIVRGRQQRIASRGLGFAVRGVPHARRAGCGQDRKLFRTVHEAPPEANQQLLRIVCPACAKSNSNKVEWVTRTFTEPRQGNAMCQTMGRSGRPAASRWIAIRRRRLACAEAVIT
jgi:hypothetical protein